MMSLRELLRGLKAFFSGCRKVLHVTDIVKGPRDLSYVISVEKQGVVEWRQAFAFHFNKDVVIYNSTILYMFETIMSAPKNILSRMTYRLVVDLKPDVDVVKLRAGYRNLLLADGTGLDSHAIRLLAGDCKKLKTVTIADLKKVELLEIDPAEYDTENSVVMIGENYLRNRKAGDVLLDFTHDGNRLYLLMLLIDHFKAKKVLTADCEKLAAKTYYGRTTDLYSCNFLYGDIGTTYVNARLDPHTYFNRLVNCGHYPPFKNLRKYLVAKYLEKKHGIHILTGEQERRFWLANDEIDIAGKGGRPTLLDVVEAYQRESSKKSGLQLLDDFALAVNMIDLDELASHIVHTAQQREVFDRFVERMREIYVARRDHYDSIRLIDYEKLGEAFGDDDEFYENVTSKLKMICASTDRISE